MSPKKIILAFQSPAGRIVNESNLMKGRGEMSLTKEQVERVARLARLELSDEMAEKMADQLSRVLEYIAKLNELDTADVEPISHPGALTNVFREDVRTDSLDREASLKNAPDKSEGFFRVPRVIE